MSFLTYPLNYIDYDYEAAETWLSTRSSGVFVKNDFDYTVTNADTIITFGEGLAWIHNHRFAGKVFRNDENFALDFGVSDNVYDRIDVAAIQFDKVKNTTQIIAKQGVAQTNPVIPAIVQTEELYELYICSVSRKAGSAYITYEDIKDLRLSPQYCGLMADSVTEVDTAKIAAQIDAFIEDLKNEINSIESGTATMMKATYDTDNDGIVDNAKLLDGYSVDDLTKKEDFENAKNNTMLKSGGEFTGDVSAYNTNRTSSSLRNIEVRSTSPTGALQSTNKIIMVRK